MVTTFCKKCPIRCGYTGTVAMTCIPKDSSTPVPGVTPEGVETNDIRPYCEAHYVAEPES